MKKNTKITTLFMEYYNNVFNRWRINKEKAGKDIVGEEYEKFRKNYYESEGFECQTHINIFNTGVHIDNVISYKGVVRIIEEDKGSYVDATFLKRALVDAATVFKYCIDNNIHPPYFILSCATKMKNYKDTYKKIIELFNVDIQKLMNEKFIYLPLCDHGRVQQKNYFKTDKNNFKLSDTLLKEQERIINKIKNS